MDQSSFLVGELSGLGFPATVLPRALLLSLGATVAVGVGFMVVMLALGWQLFCAVERLCRARGTLGMD